MTSQSTTATPPPPPPPPIQPPPSAKQGFLRRIFPLLIFTNLAVGVYILTRTSQKDKKTEESSAESKAPEKIPPAAAPTPVPVKELPPIPPEEQLQLFKWVLQEKRKIKTRDPVEKKQIDEEKALLKEILRSGSIPSL